uniref:Neuralized E3 ubiquitin protein ligase 1B n=1 Tax=Myotis lucifugus TaxID=59463 RepID=G1QCM3_MYOLU
SLPADSSPPARLLSTRPCCGPGPERRPVLGEAPRFHAQAKGKNVRLDGHSRRATRNSFCNGVTFTQRPIRLYEQVRLRLVAVRPGWSGALRFGFTVHDPSLMSPQDIPKYACPDLVTRPGYWAKALPENLALRDTVLAYWVDRHGRVFYSVNDGEPVLFHCGVAVGGPLWALIDVYGITDEVQLLGRSRAAVPAARGQATVLRAPAVCLFHTTQRAHFARRGIVLNNGYILSHLLFAHSLTDSFIHSVAHSVTPLSTCSLLYSCLHTSTNSDYNLCPNPPVSTLSGSEHSAPGPLGRQRLVFQKGRMGPSLIETFCIRCLVPPGCAPAARFLNQKKNGGGGERPGPLEARGGLRGGRRRADGQGPGPRPHPHLSSLRPAATCTWASTGRPRGRLLCVDTTQAWTFFVVRGGAAGQLRLLGTLQSSPVIPSPSGSLSGSQDDSDSDMAFSVNQSSSASESSL